MAEEYARCKCGIYKTNHCGDFTDCKTFKPLVCAKCGKALNKMTICKFDIDRDYYCIGHCPNHEWQSDFDWPMECMHCGLREKDYLRSEVTRLKAELTDKDIEIEHLKAERSIIHTHKDDLKEGGKCPKCHQGKMWPMMWCDCCSHVEEPDGTGKKVK